MKLLRWLLVLAVLAGLAYAAVAVPFGGRTLLERLRGDAPPAPAEAKASTPDPGPAERAAPKVPPAAGGSPGTDVHTEQDRRELNDLIESKLGQEQGAPDGGASDRQP